MSADNNQVQHFSDERVRPRAEAIRDLVIQMENDISLIEDVYNNLSNNPTWIDGRTDGPPHLLVPSDILAFNTLIHDIKDAIKNHASYPIILKSCVR